MRFQGDGNTPKCGAQWQGMVRVEWAVFSSFNRFLRFSPANAGAQELSHFLFAEKGAQRCFS